jgi:hypothetical protein
VGAGATIAAAIATNTRAAHTNTVSQTISAADASSETISAAAWAGESLARAYGWCRLAISRRAAAGGARQCAGRAGSRRRGQAMCGAGGQPPAGPGNVQVHYNALHLLFQPILVSPLLSL